MKISWEYNEGTMIYLSPTNMILGVPENGKRTPQGKCMNMVKGWKMVINHRIFQTHPLFHKNATRKAAARQEMQEITHSQPKLQDFPTDFQPCKDRPTPFRPLASTSRCWHTLMQLLLWRKSSIVFSL